MVEIKAQRASMSELLFYSEGVATMLEYTLLRNWVEDWCRYVAWYAVRSVDLDAPISTWFDGPVVQRKWSITNSDSDQLRFGILWSCYDLVSHYSINEDKLPRAIASS